MDKSIASSRSHKSSVNPRATPISEVMTPSTSQSMVTPISGTSQPVETSASGTYLKILEDVMGKFSPSEKLSEVFSKLAKKLKEEEGQVAPNHVKVPTTTPVQVELAEQHLSVLTASHTHSVEPVHTESLGEGEQEEGLTVRLESAEEDIEAEGPNEGTIPESVKGEAIGAGQEATTIGEEGSEDYEETLSERATRRNLRMQRKLEETEPKNQRKEAMALAAVKREAAERKRKGKSVETPSKGKKPKPALLGVVIREVTASPTRANHCQEDEQHIGAFGRQEVELDQKMLEDVVRFKDPKLRKSCAGRVSKSRPAQSGRKIHLPSLRLVGAKRQFLDYIRGIGFGWILEHTPVGVPVNLAKEFFTSFRFKCTTDLDKESVYFKFFNQDMAMNLREWSLRMGMMSPEADKRGDWSMREIGQPKEIKGFNEREAWELIGVKGAAPFKTSEYGCAFGFRFGFLPKPNRTRKTEFP